MCIIRREFIDHIWIYIVNREIELTLEKDNDKVEAFITLTFIAAKILGKVDVSVQSYISQFKAFLWK